MIPATTKVRIWSAMMLACAAMPLAAPAQPTRPSDPPHATDVAALLEVQRAKYNLPALAAVLVQGDRIIAEGVVGVRAKGQDEPATLDDQWHVGSCGKAMTATLAALCVQRQKLSWDDTVLTVFPALATTRDEPIGSGWDKATLAHMVTNTAGAPGNLFRGNLWAQLWNTNEPPAQARRLLIAGVTKRATDHDPGTAYAYSNTNFALAGAMIERRVGRPFEHVITTELFLPLSISSAGFGAPGVPGSLTQPRGHTMMGEIVEPLRAGDNPPAISPAGCIHMSIRDWAKFVSLHLQGHKRNPQRRCSMLTADYFDWLHTPVHDDYAGGWLVSTRPWAKGARADDTGVVLTHAGSNTMWMAVTWLAPERNIAVLVCTNTGAANAHEAVDAAAVALLDIAPAAQSNPPADESLRGP